MTRSRHLGCRPGPACRTRTCGRRGEALADLDRAASGARAARPGARHARRAGAPRPDTGGHGWRRSALRVAAAGCTATAAVLAVGWTPATIGVLVGTFTWVAVTSLPGLRGRGDG